MNTFTDLIQSFVQRRNLPMEQIATMANISRKTVYRWVNGEVARPRHWSQIISIASALKLTETELNQLLRSAKFPEFGELDSIVDNPYDKEILVAFTPAITTGQARIPTPTSNYDTRPTLEAPAGAVRPDSPFYVPRTADEQLFEQVFGAGTTTTIQAGRQTGKTSLLMQAIHAAQQEDRPYVYLDFQLLEESDQTDLESLLRFMAETIVEQLELDPASIAQAWDSAHGPAQKFNRFLQRTVLKHIDSQLLLAIDEADVLLDVEYKKNFFALLRAWDSRRAFDAAWRKLNLVMVISTHPYLLIDDVNLSPFNVGLTIQLNDFSPAQVADLNIRHGGPLTAPEIPALMELVGGHPYLIRQALYSLTSEKVSLTQLQKRVTDHDGPFGKHLRFYRNSLENSPRLMEAMLQIVQGRQLPDENTLERLAAVGLVRRSQGAWQARCGLYKKYFAEL